MAGLKATYINELEKMYKRKKAFVIVIISLITIILGQAVVVGIRSGFGIRGTGSMEFPLMVLSLFINTILPLFTALVAIDIFTGEFTQNTMKITLLKPVTRFGVFTAKILAVCTFVLVNLLVVMVLSTIAGIIFNASTVTFSGLWHILLAYIITLFPMSILALLIVLLSNILKGSASVFFLSMIVFIVLKALGMVFSQYSGILPTSLLGWYNLWIADTLPLSKIFREFLILAGYGIMFFTAGFYLFEKRDL